MRSLLLAAVALLAVAIANIDVHPTQTVTRVKPVTKRVVKVKKVYSERPVPAGTITRADCNMLAGTHMHVRAVIARWGWPAGDKAEWSDNERLYYRVTDHVDAESDDYECIIEFYDDKIDDVDMEEE